MGNKFRHRHILEVKKKKDYFYDSRAIEVGRWDDTDGEEHSFQCLRCGVTHSFHTEHHYEFLYGWCRVCGYTTKFENVTIQPQDYIDTWEVRLRLLEGVKKTDEHRNPEPRRK